MSNSQCEFCGGCLFRCIPKEQYQKNKNEDFQRTLAVIKNATPIIDNPIFIEDGCRRRADMAFSYIRGQLKLGFNEAGTHNIADITICPMLTGAINNLLPSLRRFLQEFCSFAVLIKNKKKKTEQTFIREGSVRILEADNGIDILLELSEEPTVEHRLSVADFVNANENVLRLSWQIKNNRPETIVVKTQPELYIAGYAAAIPPGIFLQASKEAENVMIEKVKNYMYPVTGKIADLFCGFGTFTYPLAANKENEIIAADSSSDSLKGLQETLHRNQIHNVTIINRNLFKYPFDSVDLTGVEALVIDPPRAGAHEQCREIASLQPSLRPKRIVFVSCNPKTFVYDAELLINAGYTFERVTLIDQFVYSKHQELIALFTTESNNKKGE